MRILFTGGGGVATQAWRLLLNKRIESWRDLIAGSHESLTADADPGAAMFLIPRADAPDLVSELIRLCQSECIDLLVPGVDEELLLIARAREVFPCPALLPSAGFIARHLDKWTSMQWLLACGLPEPRTQLLDGAVGAPSPLIVKPMLGRGSRHVVKTTQLSYAHDHAALHGGSERFIIQEELIGQEYTVTIVADQSKTLRAVVPVKVEAKRGVTLRGATVHDADVIDVCRRIHAAEPFSGVVNVQGIKTERGFVPFEINPRVSTTTCLAVAAGVDVFGLALAEGVLAPFREVSMRRTWAHEFTDV